MTRKLGTAPTFGLLINYNFDLHFSGGIEFNYQTFSESLSYSSAFGPLKMAPDSSFFGTSRTRKSTLNYLNIPIFGRATFGEKKLKGFITFGAYAGIGLSGKVEGGMQATTRTLDSNYSARFKPGDFKKLDLGGFVGGGFQRQIKENGTLFVEARFMLGFLDFNNDPTQGQRAAYVEPAKDRFQNLYLRPSGTWRTANITVGYFHTFKLPKKKSSNTVKKAGKQGRGRI